MHLLPPDLQELINQLDQAEESARVLVWDVDEQMGVRRLHKESWSIAQCLDHIAVTNRIYLEALQEAADQGREKGRFRKGSARPGRIGQWFIRSLEPPVKTKIKGPGKVRPAADVPFSTALEFFLEQQGEVRKFIHRNADLDLGKIRFRNPFIPGVRFNLATGLHVIPSHERRHIWQAQQIKDILFSHSDLKLL